MSKKRVSSRVVSSSSSAASSNAAVDPEVFASSFSFAAAVNNVNAAVALSASNPMQFRTNYSGLLQKYCFQCWNPLFPATTTCIVSTSTLVNCLSAQTTRLLEEKAFFSSASVSGSSSSPLFGASSVSSSSSSTCDHRVSSESVSKMSCLRGCGVQLCSDTCRRAFYSTLAIHSTVCPTACNAAVRLQLMRKLLSDLAAATTTTTATSPLTKSDVNRMTSSTMKALDALPTPTFDNVANALAPSMPDQNRILLFAYGADMTSSDVERLAFLKNLARCLIDKRTCLDDVTLILNDSLEIARKTSGENDKAFASCLAALGYCETNRGHLESALQRFEAAMKIYRRYRSGENQAIAYLANLYGATLLRTNRFDEACEKFLLARRLYEKMHAEQTSLYARTLSNIGHSFVLRRQNSAAIGYFRDAICIARSLPVACVVGDLFFHVGSCFVEMCNGVVGACVDDCDCLDEALTLYEESLAIARRCGGETNSKVAHCHDAIAWILWQKKQYDEAIQRLNRSIAIFTEIRDDMCRRTSEKYLEQCRADQLLAETCANIFPVGDRSDSDSLFSCAFSRAALDSNFDDSVLTGGEDQIEQ